jgi:acrR protein
MNQSEMDMIERIFSATDNLMAEEGLPNLSMHKIAKAAKISPGTIYIYFKNKEELLAQFARHIFLSFQRAMEKDHDETQSFAEQYRKMWWNIWTFLQSDPTIMSNMHQYESLPGFADICREWEQDSLWHHFCNKAKEAGEVADLPTHILFAISLESAINIAFKCQHFIKEVSTEMLESVIERTWRAVKNQ